MSRRDVPLRSGDSNKQADAAAVCIGLGRPQAPLVRFRAILGSRERHIGSHIVEFYHLRADTFCAGACRVNVACLEGMSPFDFQDLPVYDGTRHTSDGFPLTRAGTLIYRPAD